MSYNMNSTDMKKTFQLPMVPGATCGEELLRRDYRRGQVFGAKTDKTVRSEAVPIDYSSTLGGSAAGGTAGAVTKSFTNTYGSLRNSSGAKHTSPTMLLPQQSGNAPQDLTNRVLRYYGYFRESVEESNVEKERVRKVTINVFLEDGTVSVIEPKQDNSGIAFQGNMVKRHTIPKPDGSGPITFDMFAVGETISFYGRTYYITDADGFTRDFMASIGVEVAPAIDSPIDAHTTLRARPAKVNDLPSITATTSSHVKLSSAQIAASKQFFEHDRDVLRLTATWDDSKSLYGALRKFTVYYFLADGTFEVVELHGQNSGTDPFPSFIRRQKVFKPKGSKRFENMTATLTFAGKDVANSTYTDADLFIGAQINFFGREMTITDYDQHTRDHLRVKFGITEYDPIPTAPPAKNAGTLGATISPKSPAAKSRVPPPHNGFGTEEDSLGSWNRLEPKAPKVDLTKYNKHGNNAVKFAVRLDNGSIVDEVRRFVLTAFLADDTIAVFEPVQRNSGIVGGKFLQRQKVKNPLTGKNFIASDFFVGARVVVNSFPFVVLATDERSLSYMEQNSSEFPQSNINTVAHKLQAMLMSAESGLAEAFNKADANASGTIDFGEFKAIVAALHLDLSDQEILTLLRHFDRNGDSYITYDEFVARMMPEGSQIGKDPRSWREIHRDTVNDEHDKLNTEDKVALQKAKVDTMTAAYAARSFSEQYQARRTLFLQEFKFICDYSHDEKISEKEFRMCVVDKLKLDLSPVQVDTLAAKLFPPGSRRITYDEFVRLINSNSTRDNTLKALTAKRL